jgi:hypothetical protein
MNSRMFSKKISTRCLKRGMSSSEGHWFGPVECCQEKVVAIADYNTYPRAISTRKEPRDHQGRQERAFPNQSGTLLRAPRPKVIIPNISCWLLFKEKFICLVDCFDSTRMPVSSQGGRLRSAQCILPLLRLCKKLVCQFENLLLI